MSDNGISESPTLSQRVRGYTVHLYTASGVALAFAAAVEMCQQRPDARHVFMLLVATVLIDATDGTLARRWHVKHWAASIDGRTIDDILDYLTYTFLPLLLMWRMEWLPEPAALWIVPALIASLFGFANRHAKDEGSGVFLGFPSYWNVVAFYGGLVHPDARWINAVVLLTLAIATVLPLEFLYPNLAPKPWRIPVLVGAAVWLLMLLAILRDYPHAPLWLVLLSLTYPAFYGILSLAIQSARHKARRSRSTV